MNTSINAESSTILAQQVSDDARMDTLPKHFGRYLISVEDAVYTLMRHLAQEYRGGYWHFYELSNGGFYMAPQMEPLDVRVDTNGYEGQMSADAAGITACLFAFSHLSFRIEDERIADHYHWLLEFAAQHTEAAQILAAID